MGVTKEDTAAIAVGLGLVVLGGRKAMASSSRPSAPSLLTPPLPPGTRVEIDLGDGQWQRGTVEQTGDSATLDATGDSASLAGRRVRGLATHAEQLRAGAAASDDGQQLVRRANQPEAHAWAEIFAAQKLHPRSGEVLDMPPALAEALARWAGIESSGNPTIVSSAGERGLMQAGTQSVEEGALSPDQWEALINPETGNDAHAGIAMHYVDWLYGRAARYIKDPPTGALDQLWYTKLYHQRPVDVRDGKMHGPAVAMARELAKRWARDPKAMHRLRAANVVAWGTPAP